MREDRIRVMQAVLDGTMDDSVLTVEELRLWNALAEQALQDKRLQEDVIVFGGE